MKRQATSILLWVIAAFALLTGGIAVSASVIGSGGGDAPSRSLQESVELAPEATPIPPPPDSFPTPGGDDRVLPAVPEFPSSSDVLLGSDGKYVAVAKNGCVWKETGRFEDIAKNDIVVLQTGCVNDLILHYNPATGGVQPVGVFIVPIDPGEKDAPPAPTAVSSGSGRWRGARSNE